MHASNTNKLIGTVVLALSCGACAVGVRTQPVTVEPAPTVEVTSETIPVDIETYPSTQYEGRTVYLWGDRWYYRNGNRWSYYGREPEQLRRQRPYVQSAPPARRPERREERHEDRDRPRRD